ncbi:MAG: helix-turn-helix transcriptional regulator [Lachnospiraceae bacterium]|nr:helix-turn-helix transcriptional regulator [Lachnospiraceae bacterium]MEE3462066.1 helix-turn-helix transcriptional regulator [Lachnospiraceae bacterium]
MSREENERYSLKFPNKKEHDDNLRQDNAYISNCYSEIGQRVSAFRSALKLTQAELGEKVFNDQSKISRIERGRSSLKVEDLIYLADEFNIDLSILTSNINNGGGIHDRDRRAKKRQASDNNQVNESILHTGSGALVKNKNEKSSAASDPVFCNAGIFLTEKQEDDLLALTQHYVESCLRIILYSVDHIDSDILESIPGYDKLNEQKKEALLKDLAKQLNNKKNHVH